ncbi:MULTISPECIES: hypothetical protein [unclassified Neisseria]|uniref:hypothetical protein n=1 Tax=unclassified Neisseria TaxID=2623750 RepID=UPI001072229A|nr:MULTISPECIES: hypothetical protein [unclassified Neisseria]MBF0804031.1 hypothetical protein [Neisseria sp. 19428wB4_WF04]TFU43236.1 hypothetical protein E4T99_06625 [Neisseria sp. WF04]
MLISAAFGDAHGFVGVMKSVVFELAGHTVPRRACRVCPACFSRAAKQIFLQNASRPSEMFQTALKHAGRIVVNLLYFLLRISVTAKPAVCRRPALCRAAAINCR